MEVINYRKKINKYTKLFSLLINENIPKQIKSTRQLTDLQKCVLKARVSFEFVKMFYPVIRAFRSYDTTRKIFDEMVSDSVEKTLIEMDKDLQKVKNVLRNEKSIQIQMVAGYLPKETQDALCKNIEISHLTIALNCKRILTGLNMFHRSQCIRDEFAIATIPLTKK